MLPCYRSSATVGRLDEYELDDCGLAPISAKLQSLHANWDVDDSGEVQGVLDEAGATLSEEALEDDARRWSVIFVRHVRSQFGRNHDHSCTKTCTKYATDDKKRGSDMSRLRAAICRFLFFTILVFQVLEGVVEKTKKILRKGKQLIAGAFIHETNDRNEYGRVGLERTHPFTSSSSDLLQAALECNADYQYMDRAVPTSADSPDPRPQEPEQSTGQSNVVYGNSILSPMKRAFMYAQKAGMKAAFICDFYMTKYQSKAQQILSSALGPLLQGLRRYEAEEADLDELPSVRERALKKLRRMMFAANKSHWYSAAELAIFVLTGGHCIQTHGDKVLFTSRSHYMFQECKRLFNNDRDLTCARPAVQSDIVDIVQVTAVQPAAAPAAAPATPLANALSDLEDEPDPGPNAAAPEAELKVFRQTTTNRDDWLHRGFALVDVDWYSYCNHFERVKKPENVQHLPSTIRYFAFEKHYALERHYCQALRPNPMVVPRTVGPQCPQLCVEEGEPNAVYKATLFTPLCCMGPDHCADVQHCRPALFPDSRGKYTFRKAWQARRAQIEVLADRGQQKTDRAKRIAVIKDTSVLKDWELQSPDGGDPQLRRKLVPLRRVLQQLLQEAVVHAQLDEHVREPHVNLERPFCLMLEYLDVCTGNHTDQLSLAEFAALEIREVLFNIDMDVDARNTVVVQAKKLANCVVEDDEQLEGDAPTVEFEDVGGAWHEAEDNSEDEGGNGRGVVADKIYDWTIIESLLNREEEIKATEAPGRHADAHTNMREYADIFGPSMRQSANERTLTPSRNLRFESEATDTIQKQRDRAKRIRELELTPDAPEDPDLTDQALGFDQAKEARVSTITIDEVIKGPVAVAYKLATAATLNPDQMALVALFAYPMQEKWDDELRKKPELAAKCRENWATGARYVALLPLVGVLARIIFVGGGGCGKSRIITQVLTPLLKFFYGARGLMIEAQSNKAARGVGGITLHAANKLLGNSSLMTVHLRTKPRQRPAMEGNGDLGAKLFDECSQLNSKLWHADAYCTAVARASKYSGLTSELPKIEVERYADYDQTWGATPIVGLGGDELQLPPVPAQAGLFAPIEGTSHEQKTAVKILNSFTHVYRLTTAMRFKDEVLKEILRKMRLTGGCSLDDSEWDALEDTEISSAESPKLKGTEMWYESAYEWSIVAMSQALRSQMSAKENKKPLFIIQAEDEYLSALDPRYASFNLGDGNVRRRISTSVLKHPNMNDTGRMPGFAMLHIDMKVRLTQTTEAGIAVTDSTGRIVGIEFDEREPRHHREASELPDRPLIVLRYMPPAVYVKLDAVEGVEPPKVDLITSRPCSQHAVVGVSEACPDCQSWKGVVAVTPFTNISPWSLEVKLEGGHIATVKVKRKQLPLVCLTASTLHVLQGCTCEPGLIFHWKFPRRLTRDMVWLAVYVAISRVRSLATFRSVGLTTKIRRIIEGGPPDSIPATFEKYFGEKERKTKELAEDYMKRLGWNV
jgi:hypothetical protein